MRRLLVLWTDEQPLDTRPLVRVRVRDRVRARVRDRIRVRLRIYHHLMYSMPRFVNRYDEAVSSAPSPISPLYLPHISPTSPP